MVRAKTSFNLHYLSAVSYFVMISLLAAFLWMAFTPQAPRFQLTSLTVTSLATNTGAELTATFNVNAVLGNPNVALSVCYESLRLALLFDNLVISATLIQPLPFSTAAQTDTPVRARYAVAHRLFPDGVVRGITEQCRRGSVYFGVTVLARLRFTFGALRTRVRTLRLECYPLQVAFPSRNNGTGRLVAPSDCYASGHRSSKALQQAGTKMTAILIEVSRYTNSPISRCQRAGSSCLIAVDESANRWMEPVEHCVVAERIKILPCRSCIHQNSEEVVRKCCATVKKLGSTNEELEKKRIRYVKKQHGYVKEKSD
ncbi:unnamed protein product [Sphenostylis stenocarpa]|uniref:Late embryogenesis abundant protein LEA-2 subgroup domain-containing protein n=1 Tax=Sphenostylis stenocarpa TaxID=92480 RepID=A0AA86VZM2_9FABA|nr:unnamed protein product [Sphenostylis stenocarpa]